MTSESMPVEKFAASEPANTISSLEVKNGCFLGTSVESGTALAVVVATGEQTYLGSIARAMVGQPVQTAFEKGVSRFTWLMIRIIGVMVPVVFLIDGLTKGNWREAFFFALAVAVGMTPEMLPMIVTVCLTMTNIPTRRFATWFKVRSVAHGSPNVAFRVLPEAHVSPAMNFKLRSEAHVEPGDGLQTPPGSSREPPA